MMKLLRRSFVAVALLFAILHVVNFLRLDGRAFARSARALVERSEAIRAGARRGYQSEVLAALGGNPLTGQVNRLERLLDGASVLEEPPVATPGDGSGPAPLFSFEFDDPAEAGLVSAMDLSPLTSGHGALVSDLDPKDFLTNAVHLEIPKDEIGEILVRMRVDRGTLWTIAWSREDKSEGIWANRLDLHVIADGEFHNYVINARNALKRGLNTGDLLRKIYLRPSGAAESTRVEIDFIRFISKQARYELQPRGAVHETLAREMRRALYMLPPQAIEFEVEVPERDPWFEFGMGMLTADGPLVFRVGVREGDRTEEVFRKSLAEADTWEEARVDLAAWSGRQISLSLHVEGPRGNVAFWSNPILSSAPPKRFNVIVVLEDTLRADHLSAYGYEVPTSPFKERLIEEGGVLFTHPVSQATKTRPSVPSLMTSLLPSTTGVWSWSDMLDPEYLTLAEVLRAQGFRTASFVQNGNAGPYAGLHQGFGTILTDEILGETTEGILGEPVLSWLRRNSHRNFFAYLHCIDPHAPYDPPPPFHEAYGERASDPTPVEWRFSTEPERVEQPTAEGRRRRYDGEILHNDGVLERLAVELEELGIREETLLVLISDHGEFLGELGIWNHSPPGLVQVTRVPLILSYPGLFREKRVLSEPVQMMDVMPTILELAGVDADGLLMQGDSLVDLMEGDRSEYFRDRLVVSEEPVDMKRDGSSSGLSVIGSLHYRDWHFIASRRLGPEALPSGLKMKAFDLRNDTEETSPLWSFAADLHLRYRFLRTLNQIQSHGTDAWRSWTSGSDLDALSADPDVLEQLKSLGYVE